MNNSEVMSLVERTLNQILKDKGEAPAVLTADTLVLGGSLAIDSLDLAQIVLELQSMTGCDPFEAGFVEFCTIGELASLFST